MNAHQQLNVDTVCNACNGWLRSLTRACFERYGVMQLSLLLVLQAFVYTNPYRTQQICSIYTANTPATTLVTGVFVYAPFLCLE